MNHINHDDLEKINRWIAHRNAEEATANGAAGAMVFMSIILGGVLALVLQHPYNQWAGGICLIIAAGNSFQILFRGRHSDIDDLTH